jgi:hypothetical protein
LRIDLYTFGALQTTLQEICNPRCKDADHGGAEHPELELKRRDT